ncbi:hypothetical protein EDC94DRAFT_581457 [Helicostylum pulchrum]|nr:hypothetical protein EDC94DRAFT_581457 [Helicostylum pulchrum]
MLAIPLNWKEVTLKNHNIALVKNLLNDSNNNQYFKYTHRIKKLTISDSKDIRNQYKFSKLELLGLLNQLPNLNEIALSKTSYFEDYLEFLLDTDTPQIKKIDTGYHKNHFGRSYFHGLLFFCELQISRHYCQCTFILCQKHNSLQSPAN